jgi:hypothetical protein
MPLRAALWSRRPGVPDILTPLSSAQGDVSRIHAVEEASCCNLDALVWSGVRSVDAAAASQGLAAAGFDDIHSLDQDLMTFAGIRACTWSLPTCCSFTFPNVSDMKCSKTSFPKVGALSLRPVQVFAC